jgi:signal transduction histidine kinase
MKSKQNELYMAYYNEVSKNEPSLTKASDKISNRKNKARVVRLGSSTRIRNQFLLESQLTMTERQSFENGFVELESHLAFEKEARNLELMRAISEARQKERELIGNELHDNVNQILATAKLYVEMLAPSSAEDKDIQGKASELIRKAYDEIRTLSRKLANHNCTKQSFSNELEGLLDEIKVTRKYIVHFEHDFEEECVSSIARKNLFRIAQEQLKNILEYSKAKSISISLKQLSNQLFFIITDDGIGFDQKTCQQGLGQCNIVRRAQEMNGRAEWITEIGQGCSLMITIPIN